MVQSAFKGSVGLAVLIVAAASAAPATAQTFDVNGQTSSSTSPAPSKKRAALPGRNETGMGWGASIEVAREARAAQTALQHGDAAGATAHAQRAVNAAPQNPDLWFTLAYAARLSGQYSLSVDAYRRGLALKPSSVEGLSGLAQTYARMGRNAEAQQTLEQVLAANPKSDVDLQLAGELLLSTDPKGALEYLRRSETAKASPRTELLLARAYERTGDGESAHRMLERARRSAPANPEVLRAVASYYRDTGQYHSAIRILEDLPTKEVSTLEELGYSYALAGDAHAAAHNYGAAASRAPRDIQVQLNAAQAMLNVGAFDKATALLNQAATLNPEHYRVYALRGRLDAAQHRNADAIREYEAALGHLPDGVSEGVLYPISLRVDLAQVYRDAGDTTNAERVTKDATNAIGALDVGGPARPEFLRLRAATEVAAGKVDPAERDLKEALQLEPHNGVLLLNYANLLWKTGRKEEARKTYLSALTIDSSNGSALGALGFLSREMGNSEAARGYFLEFAKKHSEDYVPYLALGDLYSSTRQFPDAQESYEQAFQRSQSNPLIVSGAMNAVLEAHHLAQAKEWLARASAEARQDPQVMREHERYLTMTGNYAESADLGYQVIEKLPQDREAVDYLAYDLLFLKRLDEAMKIVDRYQSVLVDDRDLPLIAGHVHTDHNQYEAAVRDFTRALEIDPNMAVGYMNRGYVYNDMRLATKAEQDFRKALALNPRYGEAHLGLAYALLQSRRSSAALKEAEMASRLLPESESLHLVKAEGFRQRAMLALAESEYRRALNLNPKATDSYVALADVQYRAHKYAAAADTLHSALAITTDHPAISAQLARAYAQLGRSSDAMQAIATAERAGGKDYKVLLVTADALRIMGNRDQAMTRYSRALESSDEDRLQIRLALGRLFAEEGHTADAQQQVALGFAEAKVAPTDVTSADDYLNAGDILSSIHEYPLAQRMYGRAQALGADDAAVAVGMANVSLALGDTRSAALQLASLRDDPEHNTNYDFLVAQGNVYRQRGQDDRALATFVLANQLDPQDPATRTAEMELAEEEGHPLTDRIGMSSDVRVNPLFEDESIYQMDARLLGVQNGGALLPPPRRSIETFAASRFQFRPNSFPRMQGFIAERNSQGSISFPSELQIQDRNTFDTIFNISLAPVVQLGNVKLSIMPGLQYTLRRDTLASPAMNQNLFRQFLYVASSPIGNWLSFSGNLIREAGPFTEQTLHSRDFSGALDFRVGRPWGKTALLTGYSARDLLFGPSVHEYYQTTSYVGLQHRFGSRLRASAVAEFLRAWRVEGNHFAIAQTLRPRFGIDAKFKERWTLSASGAWSSGRGFHAYDNVTSSFMLSYTRERSWGKSTGSESASAAYPLRFSFGVEQQSFYDFPGHGRTQLVPAAQFTF
ncbi:MAG: tetratricopeptide repeat protein [Acidobacteriia bacterium]|nr:tetratricopeptide repeat protein [Terriglobia bacterium]